MIQTRTAQKRILDEAKQAGELDTLLWYMVADLGGGKTDALAVNGHVPVVRVSSDPAISEHDAHLMLELCRHYNPSQPMHLELTAIDILAASGVQWFEFGDVDLVCPTCGAVGWESCCCQPTLWTIEAEERVLA